MDFPKKVPAPTNRVVNSFRVSNPDGFRDVMGEEANETPAHEAAEMDDDFDDVKARKKRYGVFY